ncbi:MAG: biopolymer transporter ExbD [Zavarzinella sp.]
MSRKRKHEKPIELTLPITPFLDMAFQLMFFFVSTFNPRPVEGQIPIQMPKLDVSESSTSVQPPSDILNEEYTISITSGDGNPGTVSFSGGTLAKETMDGADPIKGLNDRLSKITKPTSKDAKVTITIEADDILRVAHLMNFMDVCKQNGFESIGFAPLKK